MGDIFDGPRPLRFTALTLPAPLTVAVLAPHPDDFDAIGVAMRWLVQRGHQIHVAVLTAGAGGVDDGWHGAHTDQAKAALREAEQHASCRFFGLPAERLVFLRLWNASAEAAADHERLRSYLLAKRPDLVFMPHGNDSNRTHRQTYDTFRAIALQDKLALWACLNRDAKTLAMRSDLVMGFDEEDAAWKAQLLRFHRSQHERNLGTRGIGFDQRILQVNREAAAGVASAHPYAEVFELERFG
ncbi:MAG TPA: PIG-L family deacetylase [Rhizobacter sp.]|nr:PIG-L family deacetylase [Rhizobacter sp.]